MTPTMTQLEQKMPQKAKKRGKKLKKKKKQEDGRAQLLKGLVVAQDLPQWKRGFIFPGFQFFLKHFNIFSGPTSSSTNTKSELILLPKEKKKKQPKKTRKKIKTGREKEGAKKV